MLEVFLSQNFNRFCFVFRIWVKIKKCHKIVSSFSFRKKNTSWRSQKHLTLSVLLCSAKPQQSNRSLTLLRLSTIVPNFRKLLFHLTFQFRPECCIICLVYVNRLIAFTDLPLQPTNWRPLVLCTLLVA